MSWSQQIKRELQISLGAKLTLAMTSLVLLSLIFATTVSLYQNQKIFRQQLEQQADMLLNTLSVSTVDSLTSGDTELIQNIIDQLREQEIILCSRVYQSEGIEIAITQVHHRDELSSIANSWKTKMLQSKTTILDWYSDRLIAGKSIEVDNKILGAIVVELSTATLEQKLAVEKKQSFTLAVIIAITIGIIAYCWSRSITEPLNQMITATQYLASGALDRQLQITSNDEFAVLARTFNFMASELNKTVKDLEFRAEALHQSETDASDRALELRKTLEELEDAKAIAEKANRAKSMFLSNMSHELRTPLNGILGYAQILKRDRTLTAKQEHGLNIIYDSGNHLLTLINDILDLSRIEARKLKLYPTEIHCQSFFQSIGDLIRLQAIEKGILFECALSPDLPVGIEADEKRLRQVLLNLLGNAVKFTDRGKVTLEVSISSSQNPTKSCQKTLCFHVIDTGSGINPQQLKKIFQPFEQVGNMKKREAGSGLGLAISRNLVTLMGGQISVTSKPNQGSNFWFDVTFPTVETAAMPNFLEPKRQVIGYQGKQQTILVVDDQKQNRQVILNLLEPLGFKIILGKDGQEEIDLAQKHQPDCILTDVVMPVKDGLEAVKEIRTIPSIKDTIIIAISASVLKSDRHQSRIAGCEAFLSKPFQEEQLLTLLQKHLKLKWIYEEVELSTSDPEKSLSSQLKSQTSTPPKEEIEVLYELAMLGSMKKISERADYLEELDDRYADLANQLRSLAQGFKEKAIVDLIEQYL
ncbi:response regulator [Waterburya agarophytonicola K14]|uniref:Circadian input-output histidine kinase CikA n=1 Tax=Waterburya agarophytonicola KI4 TaxID=2874699 RepID=A0A964BSW9_9CYAN|nr:ATP-binding protein [Waterburya agarophytonicola]MCC0178221.1 response regulator [Waterburya agarophytonicola KI4]